LFACTAQDRAWISTATDFVRFSFLSACGSILPTEFADLISLGRRLSVEQLFFVSSGGFTSVHGFLALSQVVFLVDLSVSPVLSLNHRIKDSFF
jgi:hypothetical protein